jgi:hypothetical protein
LDIDTENVKFTKSEKIEYMQKLKKAEKARIRRGIDLPKMFRVQGNEKNIL